MKRSTKSTRHAKGERTKPMFGETNSLGMGFAKPAHDHRQHVEWSVRNPLERGHNSTALLGRAAVGIALTLALVPGTAFASTESLIAGTLALDDDSALTAAIQDSDETYDEDVDATFSQTRELMKKQVLAESLVQVPNVFTVQALAEEADASQSNEGDSANKILAYDRADIEAIGTQESTGHSICCPSFSCAYADAVIDGTVNNHEYYTCSCCTWPDWGGGESSFRSLGTDEQLLREAYDEISAGRATVIHVSAGYGEHWIALIGYQNVTDPDHLTLANFVALDPWDGAQITASDRFVLYGDACEHVSTR